ncbi:MAG: hypothetical protein ACLPX8_26085 [Bryobacteraceae bacterium]
MAELLRLQWLPIFAVNARLKRVLRALFRKAADYTALLNVPSAVPSAFLGTDPKRSEDYFHIAHQSGVNSSALDLSFGFQMPSDE